MTNNDTLPKGLIRSPSDGKVRCNWHDDKDDYRTYHDREWGRPQDDDIKLFEKICLEGFQSGLSWLTILRKRENFRAGFAGFDYAKVAKFDDADIERLVNDAGIVRHRGKIVSTINNAARALEMEAMEGSLGAFFWSYCPDTRPATIDADAAFTPHTVESTALSKELKKRGWSFVGPTTCYAFMQAMGMVNDHIEGCEYRDVVEAERQAFVVPGSAA
ncbi:DNA-3-methyladenine glycosylase I [Ahrensia sp. R2A130]|uniref:DNA-3-methyladenine glycosylase I n=1 Tax=Ahrensia sp. R2A130 TaxID=744979 RepID=UPI0001E09460|nr:DNA-3-methyladenine glycosylase I [Ahrensia sp. R2A130]EFL88541.1 DNA-3-methyladenine glycosylase 1 [Ahrensia sp. R2A130]